MNRGYTREWYIERIKSIRNIIPDCGISTDIITGFCDESDQEHLDTLSLMKWAEFDYAYMFFYSERPKTLAERKFEDNVPLKLKKERLNDVIEIQRENSLINNNKSIGKTYKVLIEGFSKKSKEMLNGRTTKNAMVVFPKENFQPGQYVNVLIEKCTVGTLIGKVIK